MALRVALVGGPMYDGLYQILEGCDVEVVVHADHPTLNRAVAERLASGERIDVLSTHSKYAPSQAQWLRPLDGLIEPDVIAALAPAAVERCRFQGSLLCVPRNIDVRVLWANRRMIGAQAVPATWDDLVDSPLAFGFPGHESGLFGTFFEIVAGRGGRLFDEALQPTLVSDAARFAVDTLVRLARRAPPDLPEWHYDQVDAALADRRVSLAAAWPGATRRLRTSRVGRDLEPHEYFAGPRGLRSYAGVHAWAIPVTCADADGAVRLLSRLCSAEANRLEAASGAVCAHSGVFAELDGEDEVDARRLDITRRTIATGMITYPPLVRFPEIEDAGWGALHRALRGDIDSERALAAMQEAAARVLAAGGAVTRITGLRALDVRAPTSRFLDGSDAVHGDPDYSAAYVILDSDAGLAGHGMTFTIGRGTEVVCAAIDALAFLVLGRELDEVTADFAAFHRRLTNESQLRWLGPDKGVIHLATAAIVNAVWDLWAKRAGKPVWKLVCDLTPEAIVALVDWRYLSDALDRDRALDLLRAAVPGRQAREAEMRRDGHPAYITSAGWLGYPEDKVRRLCREALDAGWTRFKTKVGVDVASDVRRCAVMREEIGWQRDLMADANQVWDVPQAIEWMHHLEPFRLRWIEEPTSPDDVLGHAAIRRAVAPVGVATGEHCANKVLFKQLLQAGAIDYCQVDACRLGGLNEVLAVLLLAAHFGVPVCPHAGGLGLCEYVQHIALIDYIAVGAAAAGRCTEYAAHLHEHFVAPVRVRGGRYLVPDATGYSIEMRPESLAALAFPNGSEWRRA